MSLEKDLLMNMCDVVCKNNSYFFTMWLDYHDNRVDGYSECDSSMSLYVVILLLSLLRTQLVQINNTHEKNNRFKTHSNYQ